MHRRKDGKRNGLSGLLIRSGRKIIATNRYLVHARFMEAMVSQVPWPSVSKYTRERMKDCSWSVYAAWFLRSSSCCTLLSWVLNSFAVTSVPRMQLSQ